MSVKIVRIALVFVAAFGDQYGLFAATCDGRYWTHFSRNTSAEAMAGAIRRHL